MSQQGRGPGQPPPPGWGTPPTQQSGVPYGHPPTTPMGPAGFPPPYPQQPQAQPYPQQPQAQPYPQQPQPFPQPQNAWPQPQQQMPPQGYPQPPQYGAMQPYGYQQPMIVVQNHVQQPYPMMHPDRKSKDTATLLCFLAFFFGVHGLHRFYLRDTGMGILYVLTFGLCGIGQLIDGIKLAMMSQQEFDMRYNAMNALR